MEPTQTYHRKRPNPNKPTWNNECKRTKLIKETRTDLFKPTNPTNYTKQSNPNQLTLTNEPNQMKPNEQTNLNKRTQTYEPKQTNLRLAQSGLFGLVRLGCFV